MAHFKVFQFKLDESDELLINAKGWDASPKLKAYMNVRFGKWAPIAHKYYDLVAEIEATDLDQVFDIGNIGPESAITSKAPMHSISVGDIIMDEIGDMHLVAPMDFIKI